MALVAQSASQLAKLSESIATAKATLDETRRYVAMASEARAAFAEVAELGRSVIERPDEAPYYGSEHLMVAHLLFKEKFEACKGGDGRLDGRLFKKQYAATLYQFTKNFNFAVQYGCGRAKGDATAHRPGAYDLVKERFYKQEALNQQCIAFGNRHGYVETIPDRTVDPDRGYPLVLPRGDDGRISPTLPLNYWSQGTACWCARVVMPKIEDLLAEWASAEGFDGFITMYVHDEVVLDFPRRGHPVDDRPNSNYEKVQEIRALMEQAGRNLVHSIPTPTGCEYHDKFWDKGLSV
jgi:hypothetical protein